MQKQFAYKIEEMMRLTDNSRSASAVMPDRESKPRNLYLLAVSGGMDSMCMADMFLNSFGADSFAMAHCNFSLRAEESDADERLVRDWAEDNGVKLFVKRFDTESYAASCGISIEMAARDLRYGWFAELCEEQGFAAVSVAHNANDNAETLMLNLLRGTGLKGLHGMAEVTRMSVTVLRPMLTFTRKQIEGYVLAHRVPYRHDSSNFSSDYRRNRIRNEVFPVFEKMNPSFIRTLNSEIARFTEAGSIVEQWCDSQVPAVVSTDQSQLRINTAALLAVQQWRYLLYHILEPYGFSPLVLASIEDLLTSDRTIPGKRFESATHVLLTRRSDLLLVPQEDVHSIETVPSADEVMVVRGTGTYSFNGSRFTVELQSWDDTCPLKQPAGTIIMDADEMLFPFVCRRWRHGDWFVPLGMKGKKKVSDLFTDLKYDVFSKDSSVMIVDTRTDALASQQHIAALLGVRIDDRYKITPATRTILRISKV